MAKISHEIVQAIAVACEQLIQPPESWLYAFPLRLTIDAYQGGADTSIK
ncbi:aspartate ammonia-lyase [Acinetobacter johnsonii]|nr:aspartate ammonia-lyase [Acinetobacter johnsonii]